MGAAAPTERDIRRWRRYLADERAEAAVYRDLASRRRGEEREILLALAEAEGRHEAHWTALLGARVGQIRRGDPRSRILGFLARRFGGVFVLALAQRAEARSPYSADADATPTMAADELIHGEVIRGLADRGRSRLSGTFRAAVFGANDGLVSNLALVLGVSGASVPPAAVLVTGIAGLLAGALSMAAGEFVSISSQRELLRASRPTAKAREAVPQLDVDANELSLVYRARGMSEQDAARHAAQVLGGLEEQPLDEGSATDEAIGSPWRAALSSFAFFASGALIPVLPLIVGASGVGAIVLATVLVGVALLATGAVVGLLSGVSPLWRALRQLGIGYAAAAVTFALGSLFGAAGL